MTVTHDVFSSSGVTAASAASSSTLSVSSVGQHHHLPPRLVVAACDSPAAVAARVVRPPRGALDHDLVNATDAVLLGIEPHHGSHSHSSSSSSGARLHAPSAAQRRQAAVAAVAAVTGRGSSPVLRLASPPLSAPQPPSPQQAVPPWNTSPTNLLGESPEVGPAICLDVSTYSPSLSYSLTPTRAMYLHHLMMMCWLQQWQGLCVPLTMALRAASLPHLPRLQLQQCGTPSRRCGWRQATTPWHTAWWRFDHNIQALIDKRHHQHSLPQRDARV